MNFFFSSVCFHHVFSQLMNLHTTLWLSLLKDNYQLLYPVVFERMAYGPSILCVLIQLNFVICGDA